MPLSPADERLLIEPTEKEMEEAKALPYASLLGVCQYPSAYTRLEMRYAMSVLSRWRTKWGKVHFAIVRILCPVPNQPDLYNTTVPVVHTKL